MEPNVDSYPNDNNNTRMNTTTIVQLGPSPEEARHDGNEQQQQQQPSSKVTLHGGGSGDGSRRSTETTLSDATTSWNGEWYTGGMDSWMTTTSIPENQTLEGGSSSSRSSSYDRSSPYARSPYAGFTPTYLMGLWILFFLLLIFFIVFLILTIEEVQEQPPPVESAWSVPPSEARTALDRISETVSLPRPLVDVSTLIDGFQDGTVFTLPLRWDQEEGAYMVQVGVGKNDTVEFVLDSGSGNLTAKGLDCEWTTCEEGKTCTTQPCPCQYDEQDGTPITDSATCSPYAYIPLGPPLSNETLGLKPTLEYGSQETDVIHHLDVLRTIPLRMTLEEMLQTHAPSFVQQVKYRYRLRAHQSRLNSMALFHEPPGATTPTMPTNGELVRPGMLAIESHSSAPPGGMMNTATDAERDAYPEDGMPFSESGTTTSTTTRMTQEPHVFMGPAIVGMIHTIKGTSSSNIWGTSQPTRGQMTLLEHLYRSSPPVWSTLFGNDSGWLIFGRIPDVALRSTVPFFPLVQPEAFRTFVTKFYVIPILSISIRKKGWNEFHMLQRKETPLYALLDTGTTLTYGSPRLGKAMQRLFHQDVSPDKAEYDLKIVWNAPESDDGSPLPDTAGTMIWSSDEMIDPESEDMSNPDSILRTMPTSTFDGFDSLFARTHVLMIGIYMMKHSYMEYDGQKERIGWKKFV